VNHALVALLTACAPLVHPVTMSAVVSVESAAHPYALSINYPERLVREGREVPALDSQPASAREAMGWTREFLAQGYTVSVGLAQINVERIDWLKAQGIARNLADLFEPCRNLRAAQAILLECWNREADAPLLPPRLRLHRTLSCYNSGNPVTGLRNGYVHRVTREARRVLASQALVDRSRVP
jgi:type IV secretion system protein VirB1